jgi:hypothetical protein
MANPNSPRTYTVTDEFIRRVNAMLETRPWAGHYEISQLEEAYLNGKQVGRLFYQQIERAVKKFERERAQASTANREEY